MTLSEDTKKELLASEELGTYLDGLKEALEMSRAELKVIKVGDKYIVFELKDIHGISQQVQVSDEYDSSKDALNKLKELKEEQ